MAWDVTVTDIVAASNISFLAIAAVSAAERAAETKVLKYSELSACYEFAPVAFETLGPANSSAVDSDGH